MNRYAQRLSRVARALGCRIHGEPLSCPACQVPDPLPEPLTTSAGDFIQAILARVGQAALRDICLRVLPPNHGPCARCGTARQCLSCQVQYTKDVFRAIPLTADEQARLETILATCRRLEHEGRAHDEL
jgi:hypothetical protein